MPRYRSSPEDFLVEEIPLYPATGEGPFLWLWLEKRGRDTAEVARDLAEIFAIPRREVGWAGRKDRHAVTRQAMTLPAAVEPHLARVEQLEGVSLLGVQHTDERLRTGQLIGNRFELKIRDVSAQEASQAQLTLETLSQRGLPNRFGAQRYGRDGRNAERGRALLTAKYHRGDRRRAFLMISALQSLVFDEVLKRRPIDELWPGDLAVFHGTGDWRWIDRVEDWQEALDRFDISPTGPIFGTKTKQPRGQAAELEAQVMSDLELPPVFEMKLPKGLKLFGDRRALRARPGAARCSFDSEVLDLSFELPAGSYATVLLEALFPEGLVEGPALRPPSPPEEAPANGS